MTPCMTAVRSAGLDDLARLDAAGADVDPLRGAVHRRPDTLDVRVPATLGTAMRVRHRHAPRGALATHFTLGCHWILLQRCRDHPASITLGGPERPRRVVGTAMECYQATRRAP